LHSTFVTKSFFFTDPPHTEFYPLSLHDALPIYQAAVFRGRQEVFVVQPSKRKQGAAMTDPGDASAMQSLQALHQKLDVANATWRDRKSTRLNSSHSQISYAVFCLKKKK